MTEETNWKVVPCGKRGFAAMSPEKRKEIASKGGKSVPASKRAFLVNRDLAVKAGRKSGQARRPEKRPFHLDRDLASRAGKKRQDEKVAE
jgi:general stress protein YciG